MHKTMIVVLAMLIFGCGGDGRIPDVSASKVTLVTERFETAFFALDTGKLELSLQQLHQKYPGFTQDFLFNILGTTPDSALEQVPQFISSYQGLANDAAKKFADFSKTTAEIKRGLQFVHYYFPQYKLPSRLVTFIGPINSFGNIITPDALAVGLQLYMGKDYPLYLSEQGQQLYPTFVSRKFDALYIPVNCIRNILDDMYPLKNAGNPLVEQMVESGKRQYLVDLLMPEAADSIKTGYTQKQLNDCYSNEKRIWSFFVQNNLLYNTDPNLTRDYMNDGPNTPTLGEGAPGNIGQFTGTQIVRKWMDKNRKVTPDELMHTSARQIFEEAKYKP